MKANFTEINVVKIKLFPILLLSIMKNTFKLRQVLIIEDYGMELTRMRRLHHAAED